MRKGKTRAVKWFLTLCMMMLCFRADRMFGYAMNVSQEAQTESRSESRRETEEDLGISDEELEQAFSDNSTEELSDEEMELLIEQYMTQFGMDGSGQISSEGLEIQKIRNPELIQSEIPGGGIRYTLPNGSYFSCNIPMGMITNQPVEFSLSQNMTGVLIYNDEMESLPGAWYFQDPGTYRIQLISYQTSMDENEEYQVYEVDYPFMIIGQTDSSLGAMPAPKGFQISGVWLDGKQVEVEDERCFFFQKDGSYIFRFEDQSTGTIRKELSFTRDTKAPFLTFSGEIVDGTAEAPLEIIPSEPGCKVLVGYKGNYGYISEYILTSPGSYELSVEDSVGNVRMYHVNVRQVFQLFDIRLLGAGIVLLALLAGRLIFLRRDMRVL